MQDIICRLKKDWLVIGWFTPDYRHLAQQLAADLDAVDAPYHLFAVAPADGSIRQITRMRPVILRKAMQAYPNSTIISMDVDCRVHAPLQELTTIRADVGHYMKPRPSRKISQRGRMRFGVSDRVMVFAPTPGALAFLGRWEAACLESNVPPRGGSEWVRSQIMASSYGCTFEVIPREYAGFEKSHSPQGAVITHNSEFERRKRRIIPKLKSEDWKQIGIAVLVITLVMPLLWVLGDLE